MVVDPGVKGKVSMRFGDAPWTMTGTKPRAMWG